MFHYRTIPLDIQNVSLSVVQIRPSPKPGATLAYADVRIGPVVILGVAVIQNKNGGQFVALPSTRGQSHRFPIVTIDEPVMQQVRELALEAWNGLREKRSEIPS